MTHAAKAEVWRLVTLAMAFGTVLGVAIDDRWTMAAGAVGGVFAGEIWRWHVHRKWDDIERRRREERYP